MCMIEIVSKIEVNLLHVYEGSLQCVAIAGAPKVSNLEVDFLNVHYLNVFPQLGH